MVGEVFSLKSFEQNRMTNEDFPTAASPTSQVLSATIIEFQRFHELRVASLSQKRCGSGDAMVWLRADMLTYLITPA